MLKRTCRHGKEWFGEPSAGNLNPHCEECCPQPKQAEAWAKNATIFLRHVKGPLAGETFRETFQDAPAAFDRLGHLTRQLAEGYVEAVVVSRDGRETFKVRVCSAEQ